MQALPNFLIFLAVLLFACHRIESRLAAQRSWRSVGRQKYLVSYSLFVLALAILASITHRAKSIASLGHSTE